MDEQTYTSGTPPQEELKPTPQAQDIQPPFPVDPSFSHNVQDQDGGNRGNNVNSERENQNPSYPDYPLGESYPSDQAMWEPYPDGNYEPVGEPYPSNNQYPESHDYSMGGSYGNSPQSTSGNNYTSRNQYNNQRNNQGGNRNQYPTRNQGNQQGTPLYQQGEIGTGDKPFSREGEQSVLGSMLKDKKCIPIVMELLKEDDFYEEINRDIYNVIYGLFNLAKKTDLTLIHDAMLKTGKHQAEEAKNYLMYLVSITPTATNVKEYIQIVKDKTLLRKLADIACETHALVQSGTETGATLLEAAEQKIAALRRGRAAAGLENMESVMSEVQESLMELADRGSDVAGLSTGLSDLDRSISGLKNSELILLAARPGMGKTSMALNFLLEGGKHSGKTVVFFSLEMSRVQLGMRLVATESFVDNKKLGTGTLSDKEWGDVSVAMEALVETNILIDDDAMITVAEINARCRRVENLGLIIIDYLQLMQSAGGRSSGGGENRQQVVSDISRSLKIMAKDLDVPVVCLSQLSRASEKRENKRPMLSDLRESGAIEQDADIVMFLYREDYYEKDTDNQNVAECIIAKNRSGETGTVELEWLPQFTAFRTIERRYEEPR